MKQLVYKSIKITLGVIIAVIIAEFMNLQFTTTAGVIAMLSILNTRKQTLIIGLKRIGISSGAVVVSGILFAIFGHSLVTLTMFLLIFIPTLILIKSTESLTIATVLVTHIYTINDVTSGILLNEVLILLIGVMIAWVLNIHVLNVESDIKATQKKTEVLIKNILNKMQYQLLNQCDLCEQDDSLEELDQILALGMNLSIEHNNNYIIKDINYYVRYFQMRRQQYLLLTTMQKYFDTPFITPDMVKPLSDFTKRLSEEFNEYNVGKDLIVETNRLLKYYRKQNLPITRDEFEHRAILFMYLNDMIHFVEIKIRFMKKHGKIKYYGE